VARNLDAIDDLNQEQRGNMKSLSAASAAMGLCALLLAPDVFAYQPLCSNSPENPTLILGLLGGAAASYPVLRDRARSWLKRKSASRSTPESQA